MIAKISHGSSLYGVLAYNQLKVDERHADVLFTSRIIEPQGDNHGNVNCFVDDGKLIVKDAGAPLKDRVRILGMNSGLVGIPKRTDKGVQVQYLIDAESQLGGTLRLDSRSDKSLNGDYEITELKFDIDTHGDNFFYTATGVRL